MYKMQDSDGRYWCLHLQVLSVVMFKTTKHFVKVDEKRVPLKCH